MQRRPCFLQQVQLVVGSGHEGKETPCTCLLGSLLHSAVLHCRSHI